MAINVNVSQNSGFGVRVNSSQGTAVKIGGPTPNTNVRVDQNLSFNPVRFTTNANPVIIRNDALIAHNELKQLSDVVLQDESDGNTLVYNAENQTFILESPDYLNITNIDGGSF